MLIYKMSSWLIKIGINYIQVLVFDNTNQQITFICILNNISPIAFRIERPHNLEIPEIVHMGPSLCYVSTFLDFIWPTHPPYVSINSTERQQKNAIFLTPPTQSFCWCNIGMVPIVNCLVYWESLCLKFNISHWGSLIWKQISYSFHFSVTV